VSLLHCIIDTVQVTKDHKHFHGVPHVGHPYFVLYLGLS